MENKDILELINDLNERLRELEIKFNLKNRDNWELWLKLKKELESIWKQRQ